MGASLQEQNLYRWNSCHVYSSKGPRFEKVAERIAANRERYEAVSKRTGVPWWFIGVVHYRESDLNFDTYLGNGQPLSEVTTIVPKGRGPFSSWEDGALDALVHAAPYAASNSDWSVGAALTMLEKYNGLGYYNRDLPSPYVWAGTNQYAKGKFIRDGVFDPSEVDEQLGCAGIVKFLGVFPNVNTAAQPQPTETKTPMSNEVSSNATPANSSPGVSVSTIASQAAGIIENVIKFEPYMATAASMFVPGAKPVVAMVQPYAPVVLGFVDEALQAIAQHHGGQILPALIELLQHLQPGAPNSPRLENAASPNPTTVQSWTQPIG